jgi:hypothetical protein
MAMPAAQVTCNFIFAIGSKNLRYGLIACEIIIFSIGNKNLRLRLIFRFYTSLLAE